MDAVVVRQAVLADLDTLAGLFNEYRQFQGKAADLPACRAFLQDRFNHAESIAFLATIAAEPVGFAAVDTARISTASVRPPSPIRAPRPIPPRMPSRPIASAASC